MISSNEGSPMHFRLKVVRGKPQGHCLAFPVGEFMFGRGPECDVRPNSDLVSRQHCLLHITNDAVLIRDLGSRNGTLVNGALVLGERDLTNGDTLQIGPLVLEVLLEVGDPIASKSITDTALVDQDATLQQASMGETTCAPIKIQAMVQSASD
jgi:pSer/pThr/pTyr-binding forkhead associated (FHA) protein